MGVWSWPGWCTVGAGICLKVLFAANLELSSSSLEQVRI